MNIGFIGIGQMGRWMVEHLLKAGYNLTMFDTNPDATISFKDARTASSIKELGAKSDIVILMLPNSPIVESVVTGDNGLFRSMKPGGIIIDMSSSYVLSTKKLSQKAASTGLTFVDAPVSGGVKGAKAGTLTIMVGAQKEVYLKVLPILKTMGKTVNLIGETGSGHALKAINNYLSATSLYATTEAAILLKKLNIDLDIALETINQSSGQSFSTHYKFPTFVLPRSFNSGFSLDLILKDVKMVNDISRDLHIPVFLAGSVEQIYKAASISGDHNQDHTEIVTFLENITSVQLNRE
ncbi:NAD(P)-dependent oxidoreductase [Halalkalibacter oceani]|uniref:NAD(P)-dependent oxidoreductase n=1 Tax=Halalkalibacter oceani TaxID=1653776 RepID=UPI0033912EED